MRTRTAKARVADGGGVRAGAGGIVRLKDVADRGNVSVATVSQILRGNGAERYSAATRDKVHKAASELGWSPNRLVRGIQTGRSGMAGLVMIPTGDYWHRLAIGLQTTLLARDCVPLSLQPDYDGGDHVNELGLLKKLMELRVEGLVCWPLIDAEARAFLSDVCARQVPVATLDFQLPGSPNAVEVRTREHKAIAAALDHLVPLGHERIGYVGFATPGDWVVDRRAAFHDEMRARGLEPAFVRELVKGDNPAAGPLAGELRRATAVVAATEQLAVSAWHVAVGAGLNVPEDVSIVGFGQFHFDFALWPRFTSIDQQPEEIGRVAAMLISDAEMRRDARLSAERESASAVPYLEVEPTLVLGQTTAPPKG